MSISERIKLVRMIEKMNENKDLCRKLGIRNVSVWKKPMQSSSLQADV